MRRGWILALVVLLLFSGWVGADADENVLEDLERQWQDVFAEYDSFFPGLGTRGERPDFGSLIIGLLRYVFYEIWVSAALMGQLLVLAVLASLLHNLQVAFGNEGITRIGRGVVFLILFSICLRSFTLAMGSARGVISGMSDFTLSLVPVLLALLAGMGSLTAAAVFQPLLFTAAAIIGVLISDIVMPLLFLAVVLALVDKMVTGAGLERLARFLKDGSLWFLGLLLTAFVGITVINGTVAAVADGVALRTGKFAAKASVPVVGGMFADAFETVAGASLVLKNSVGVYGLLTLAAICLFPLLKLFVVSIIYRFAAALLQPLGEEGISSTLDTMASYMFALIGVLAGAALMFFFVITIIITSANLMIMVR